MFKAAAFALCLFAAGPCLAQSAYKAPRTPFGTPDLQGYWMSGYLTTLERPDVFKTTTITQAEAIAFEKAQGGKPTIPGDAIGHDTTEWWELGLGLARVGGKARTAWITQPADGKLPYNAEGLRRIAAFQAGVALFDNPETRPVAERCLMAAGSRMGPPLLNSGYSNDYQIVQTRDAIAIHGELIHDVRIVRMNDRTHLPKVITPWMGDSIGWWEGDTLVVETTNLNPIDTLRTPGRLMLSPAAVVTERFTRVSDKELRYQFSVDDPTMFTQVWRGDLPFLATKDPVIEFACHEGNYSLTGMLAGGRQQDERNALAGR